MPGGDAQQRGGARSGGGDQRLQMRVELSDLLLEQRDAPSEAAQRGLGRVDRVAELVGAALAAAAADLRCPTAARR